MIIIIMGSGLILNLFYTMCVNIHQMLALIFTCFVTNDQSQQSHTRRSQSWSRPSLSPSSSPIIADSPSKQPRRVSRKYICSNPGHKQNQIMRRKSKSLNGVAKDTEITPKTTWPETPSPPTVLHMRNVGILFSSCDISNKRVRFNKNVSIRQMVVK
jgi:hypothetical protein